MQNTNECFVCAKVFGALYNLSHYHIAAGVEHELLLDDKTRQIDAVYRIENSSGRGSGMKRYALNEIDAEVDCFQWDQNTGQKARQ